jgi:putative tricarboxylic transport membrane protein
MIRTADIVTAAVLMLVGGIALFDSLRLGIGWGSDGPKSGFFPFWLAVIMLTACLGIVLQALARPRRAPFVTREQLDPVLKVLWPATALVVATQFVGLYVASAVYIGFYMRWIGRHSWLAVAVLGLGIPVATFLVFEKWFLVPMPKGPLEAWLGY